MLPWDKEVFGCTKDRIEACTKALSSIQMMQIDDPMSSGLLQAEVNYRRQLAELCWQEESRLRQNPGFIGFERGMQTLRSSMLQSEHDD